MTFTEGGLCVEELSRWNADGAEETLRVKYPLTNHSVVLDIGGFDGWWSLCLMNANNVRPRIHLFEPVPQFAARARERLLSFPNVTIHESGLADHTGTDVLRQDLKATGAFARGDITHVRMTDVADLFSGDTLDIIDLASINIEGGEYRLLQRLIETGYIKQVNRLQVQFHNLFPAAPTLRDLIRKQLEATHIQTYLYPFVWEGWHLR